MLYTSKEFSWSALSLVMTSGMSLAGGLWLVLESYSYIVEWVLLESSSGVMKFILYLDWMSLVFFGFVSFISSAVLLYSGSYMEGEPRERLFIFLVLMFILSMGFLVFSLNLVCLMLGWDGLGVISYILVVFYSSEKASAAGMITALSNRVGDAALMLSVALMVEFSSWSVLLNLKSQGLLIWLVALAAITKSAQVPFSAWLPAAMAAPTPVSALVHSSTLVTAGVYLLIRYSHWLSGSLVADFLFYLGLFTTSMASFNALWESDMKKVIALSTLSQLGLMVSIVALGLEMLAFLHLLIHALFKALLFLCGGKVIHSVGVSQDFRHAGGLMYNLPITSMVMNLANLALCGIPFMSGFYSKDLFVESGLMESEFLLKYFCFSLVVGLSASYSLRFGLVALAGVSKQVGSSESSEMDWRMVSAKLFLVGFSVSSGALLFWVCGTGPMAVVTTYLVKWLAILSISLGFLVGLYFSQSSITSGSGIKGLVWKNLASMVGLPVLSGAALGESSLMYYKVLSSLDLGWSELAGGRGAFVSAQLSSVFSFTSQAGYIKSFLVVFALTMIAVWSSG